MRTDFNKIADGSRIILHPNAHNILHSKPVAAIYQDHYFCCDGTAPEKGPDYYLYDIEQYMKGFDYE